MTSENTSLMRIMTQLANMSDTYGNPDGISIKLPEQDINVRTQHIEIGIQWCTSLGITPVIHTDGTEQWFTVGVEIDGWAVWIVAAGPIDTVEEQDIPSWLNRNPPEWLTDAKRDAR